MESVNFYVQYIHDKQENRLDLAFLYLTIFMRMVLDPHPGHVDIRKTEGHL